MTLTRDIPMIGRAHEPTVGDTSIAWGENGWSRHPDDACTLYWHAAVLAAWMEANDVPRGHIGPRIR
jgi:hypothetical protein